MSGSLSDGFGPLTDGLGRAIGVAAPGNLCLGYRNLVMNGPVVVSSAVPGLGGEQLQDDQGAPSSAWQTPGGNTTGAILLSRTAGTVWRGFGLFRTNLTPAATVDWFVLAGAANVYVGRSAPVASGFGQAVHVAPQDQVGDSMQVNISDPGNPDGFLSVALMYAGPVWQTARNYGYASAILPTDSTASSETRGGAEFVRMYWRKRGFDLSLPAVAPEEVWTRIDPLDLTARSGANILLVPNPTSATLNCEAVFGRMKPAGGLGYNNNSARTRGWRATITERL